MHMHIAIFVGQQLEKVQYSGECRKRANSIELNCFVACLMQKHLIFVFNFKNQLKGLTIRTVERKNVLLLSSVFTLMPVLIISLSCSASKTWCCIFAIAITRGSCKSKGFLGIAQLSLPN